MGRKNNKHRGRRRGGCAGNKTEVKAPPSSSSREASNDKDGGAAAAASAAAAAAGSSSFHARDAKIHATTTPPRHPIGSRVEFPDLTPLGIALPDERDGSSSRRRRHVGTIVQHWGRREGWPASYVCPYVVVLDDGTAVFCPPSDPNADDDDDDEDDAVGPLRMRASDSPPMSVKYSVGSRVECRLGEGDDDSDDDEGEDDGGGSNGNGRRRWFPGTVIQVHENWARDWHVDRQPPYRIDFDYGRQRPFWGPESSIRPIAETTPSKKRRGTLRFDRGDRVDCAVDQGWMPGTIIATWYTEDEFDRGHEVPYQIQLDDTGDLIYAPVDSSDYVRRTSTPRKALRFEVGERVECAVVDEGWRSGIVTRRWYHMGRDDEEDEPGRIVPYQIALSTGEMVYAPVDDDYCVHRPARFEVGTRVEVLLVDDDGGDDCENSWIPGQVTETWCEDDDDSCDHYKVVPYKVKLDTAESVLVTRDADECIQRSNAPNLCRGQQNGFIRAMSSMMIHQRDYDGATKLLEERIELIRRRIDNEEEGVDGWVVDLSSYLVSLADVHLAKGDLEDMRRALVEALFFTKALVAKGDEDMKRRVLFVLEKLAYHASLVEDEEGTLNYLKQAIDLGMELHSHPNYRLGSLLFQCGKLSVRLNDEVERGIEQMTEGVAILARVCGSDDQRVVRAKETLITARQVQRSC